MSTTETDELVKRLRIRSTLWEQADHDRKEAADRLVSLQGEVERHNETLKRAYVALYDAAVWAEEAKPEAVGFYDSRATECREALERAGVEWDRKFPLITQVERLSQPSPAGWQLVPIEPTREHYERYAGDRFTSFRRWSEVYHDMLAAAPSAPPQASQPRHGIGDDKGEYGHEG
jgi:hypothetical protein